MPYWEIPLGSGHLGLPDLALGALACCSRQGRGAGGVGKDGVSWAPQVSLLVLGLSCPPWLGWEMASLPHVGLPSVPTALALAGTSDLLGTPAGSLEEGPQQITSVLLPVRPPGLCAGRGTAQSGSPLGLGSGVESCVSLAAHD